jgi:hypothetical protein
MDSSNDNDEKSQPLQDLATRYAPILHFDSRETMFPCSIEYLVANSILINGSVDVIKERNTMNPDDLAILQEDRIGAMLSLRPSTSCREGFKTVNDAPYYATVTDYGYYWCIQYIFIYTRSQTMLGFNCIEWGEKEVDIQHITMHVGKETEKISKVYFSGDGTDGQWCSQEDLFFDPSDINRAHVYVSAFSHHMYPEAGTWWRCFGLQNDHCDGDGPKCLDAEVELVDEDTPWMNYRGWLGGHHSHQKVPRYCEWWRNEDKGSSDTLSRLFYM